MNSELKMNQLRLLIVEDDDQYFKLLQKYFAMKTLAIFKSNIVVERAQNLAEALIKFRLFSPHSILLDLNFPDYPTNRESLWLPQDLKHYINGRSLDINAGNYFLTWLSQEHQLGHHEVPYPIWIISADTDNYQPPALVHEQVVIEVLDKATLKDTFMPAIEQYYKSTKNIPKAPGGVKTEYINSEDTAMITFFGAYTIKDISANLNFTGEVLGKKTHGELMRNLNYVILDISMVADTHKAFPGLDIAKHKEYGVKPPNLLCIKHNPQQKPELIRLLVLTLFPDLENEIRSNEWYNVPTSRIALTTDMLDAQTIIANRRNAPHK